MIVAEVILAMKIGTTTQAYFASQPGYHTRFYAYCIPELA